MTRFELWAIPHKGDPSDYDFYDMFYMGMSATTLEGAIYLAGENGSIGLIMVIKSGPTVVRCLHRWVGGIDIAESLTGIHDVMLLHSERLLRLPLQP